MEQLLIFLVVALGSLISGYLQKKKRREAEEAERRMGNPEGTPPALPRPATARDWQEELRRMLQGEPPEPAVPPKIPAPPPAAPPMRKPVTPPAKPRPELVEAKLVLPS